MSSPGESTFRKQDCTARPATSLRLASCPSTSPTSAVLEQGTPFVSLTHKFPEIDDWPHDPWPTCACARHRLRCLARGPFVLGVNSRVLSVCRSSRRCRPPHQRGASCGLNQAHLPLVAVIWVSIPPIDLWLDPSTFGAYRASCCRAVVRRYSMLSAREGVPQKMRRPARPRSALRSDRRRLSPGKQRTSRVATPPSSTPPP